MTVFLPPELRRWEPKDRGYRQPATSWEFEEMSAALFWHLSPSEFYASSPDDKARMIAMRIAQSTLEAYSYEQSEQAAANESSGGSRR